MASASNTGETNYEAWIKKCPNFTLVTACGEELKCHKSFLAMHSPVFDSMINSEFKEARADKAEIKGFSVDTVRLFLERIYEKTEVVGRKDDSEEFMRLRIVLENCFYGHQGNDLYDSERANVIEVRNRFVPMSNQFVFPLLKCGLNVLLSPTNFNLIRLLSRS